MSFKISEKEIYGLQTIGVRDDSGFGFEVIPDLGAAINGLYLNLNGKIRNVLRPVLQQSFNSSTINEFINSWLFPFPNRLDKGVFSWDGNLCVCDQGCSRDEFGNALHGFLWKEKFSIENIELKDNVGRIHLKYVYDNLFSWYPYKFEIYVIYSYNENRRFRCEFLIHNVGEKSFPFGLGWHPYFSLSDNKNDIICHCQIKSEIEINERKIPTGRLIEVMQDEIVFDNQTNGYDKHFLLHSSKNGYNKITIKDKKNKNKLEMVMPAHHFPYLQIYCPEHHPSIAIEPMSCMIDGFNNKNGILKLVPFQIFATFVEIRVI